MERKLFAGVLLALAVLAAASPAASAQKKSLGVNIADAVNFGAASLDCGAALSQRVSVHLGGRYCNWGFGSGDGLLQNRKRTFYGAVRFWPWTVWSGWWLQGKLQYNEINSNILTGRYTDPVTDVTTRKKTEGDAFGVGIAGGYTLMLTSRLNLDLGLGGWGGVWTGRKTYAKAVGGRLLGDETLENSPFILPDDVIISLQFVF